MSKRESFYLPGRELRATTGEDGNRYISGIVPYGTPSAGLPWTETIQRGAFADALKPGADVLLLRDHQSNLLLGRTLAGTLALKDTPEGLQFRCKLPNTTTAADLLESMARKDIDGVSFGFSVKDDAWSDDGAGNLQRSLRSVNLFELSVTSFAAYPDASASIRSVPRELRPLLKRSSNPDGCECDCEFCEDDDCENCSDEDCEDPNCDCSEDEERSAWSALRLRIEVAKRL